MNKLIKYKGYYVEIGDTNYDSPTEYICTIYKNKQDYENGDSLEDVSLEYVNANIVTEIEDYLNDNYIEEETDFDIDNFIDKIDYNTLLDLCVRVLDIFEINSFNEGEIAIMNDFKRCRETLESIKNEQNQTN